MLRHIEGFETNDNTTCFARRYSAATSPGSPIVAGRLHGDCMLANTNTFFRTRSLSLQNTWVFGFGYRYNAGTIIDDTDSYAVAWVKGTEEQVRLQIRKVAAENTFEFILWRGATELARTSDAGASGKFTALNWHYFEFKITIDPVNGAYEFRHNTQVILTEAGPINTAEEGTAGADIAEWPWRNAFSEFDDIYILDATGAVNNDFLGDSVIEGRVPTGDSVVVDWNIENDGVGTIDELFEAVEELSCGGSVDNQYIWSATILDQAMLSFNALSFITGQIHCVNMRSECRLDTTGLREFRHMLRSGGTDYFPGVTHSVSSTAYSSFEDIVEVDPDTAVKWTIVGVNAAIFGVELVS